MNFDAVVSKGGATVGEFIASLSKHYNYISSVEIAELHAGFETLHFALEVNF